MSALPSGSLEKITEGRRYFFPEGREGQVLLAYHGAFDQKAVDSVVSLAESAIIQAGSKRRVMKRIGSIIIELLQNISIHSAQNEDGLTDSFMVLEEEPESYRLITGNLILSSDVGMLDYKLSELNALSQNELRKLYIETLCNENFSYKGGAGLGFLTVAKKAIEPFRYYFESVDERFSYFVLEVKLEH